MKVKVNIINTWCITMSEAVTMPSLMMMTSLFPRNRLRGTHKQTHTDTYIDIEYTDKQTQTLASSMLKFFKVKDFENNEPCISLPCAAEKRLLWIAVESQKSWWSRNRERCLCTPPPLPPSPPPHPNTLYTTGSSSSSMIKIPTTPCPFPVCASNSRLLTGTRTSRQQLK